MEVPNAVLVNVTHLAAGERIAVAASAGADSTALLRWMAAEAGSHGWTIIAAHYNHGLRGEESNADEAFVRELAESLGIAFIRDGADRIGDKSADPVTTARVAGRSIEDAARTVRYGFFRRVLSESACDAVVTAHTLTDQAETVLMKMLRGAWTEGIAGIAPEVRWPQQRGHIVRPLLAASRADVEAYLRGLGHPWRDDSTNTDAQMLRNDVRHNVMPLLRERNPGLDTHLAQMAQIAGDEENYWATETARTLGAVLLPGRAVRGGGRAVSTTAAQDSLAIDAARLLTEPLAVQRRVLRAAAARLGCAPSFDETARLLDLLGGRSGRKTQLARGVRGERTARELRFESGAAPASDVPADVICIGAVTDAPAFGLRVTLTGEAPATLRVWRAGDRVRLRYTLTEQKVKEVLQRLKIPAEERAMWPVLERGGRIVWMRGAEAADAGGAVVVPVDGLNAPKTQS